MVKVFFSNCYVNDHVLYSKCPHVADTSLQLLGKVLYTLNNGFLQQGSLDSLQLILQLGICFGYSMMFVCGYCKQQRCGLI